MIYPAPLCLGLTGYPLQHSLSPSLHNAALQACELDGRYDLFPIEPTHATDLQALTARLRRGELHGLNVTIPHKQSMLLLVDETTASARAIGAVNTLYMEGSRLIGDNTDAPGFLADLNHHNPSGPGQALVLGAGGSARAVVYALQSTGWRVSLAARRPDQSAALQADFPGLAILPLNEAGLGNWKPAQGGLIVNATSAGMSPHTENSPWPAHLPFPASVFIYDLVYNPAETRLLTAARKAGLDGCSGLGMLVEQAALAFECWTTSLKITCVTGGPRLAMYRVAAKLG